MNFQEMSDDEISRIANSLMANLMEASTEINHEKHIRDFSDRMKNIVTNEYLQVDGQLSNLWGEKSTPPYG